MKDIVAKAFQSPLAVDQMVEALRNRVPDVSWGGRESEHDDVYVLGRTSDGVKIRILKYQSYNELEVYFPTNYSDDQKEAFMNRIASDVLPTLGAVGVVDA